MARQTQQMDLGTMGSGPVDLLAIERDPHEQRRHARRGPCDNNWPTQCACPRFQIDHQAVLSQAKKIVGDEKDTLEKAKRIEKWVYKTLKKAYDANADSALEILENKAGDCTEHTLIFVALCRASGVPAREVGGLAYIDQPKPLFGWHAWAEIHDGHQWVSIDPTWNQVYVDGTHLKMSEGDRDLTWTNVIGSLKIKVVEVKSRE